MRFAFLPATALLFCSILGSGLPVVAQSRDNDNRFYDGARRGAQGGNYGGGNYHHGNDHYYDNRNQGGIGPGKGALIGGAAGAALGAVYYQLEIRINPWWMTRNEVEAARAETRRDHALSAAPALWVLVVLIALTLPVLTTPPP